jgi:hypothetical protein
MTAAIQAFCLVFAGMIHLLTMFILQRVRRLALAARCTNPQPLISDIRITFGGDNGFWIHEIYMEPAYCYVYDELEKAQYRLQTNSICLIHLSFIQRVFSRHHIFRIGQLYR